MKTDVTKFSPKTLALFATLTLAPLGAFAQGTVVTTTAPTTPATTTTATTTTTSAGTISEFTPGSRIIVRTSAGSPATYSVSRTTTYVDEAGNTVTAESIRPGTPTTVHYIMENGQPVVSKVVVQRTVTTPVTPARTTTSETTETTTSTSRK